MPSSFGLARTHIKYSSEYRKALAEGRVKAVRLCIKLLDIGLQENGPINRDIIDAMCEILRDAREVLAKKNNKKRVANGSGIPGESLAEAMRVLGETDNG